MYYSARLFDEVISLEKNNNTGKVDHPPNGHKDVSDAVCGAVYNASKNAEQYAFDYGDDLDVKDFDAEPAEASFEKSAFFPVATEPVNLP